LTRWGHSSAVYDNKIYIFGGRFSNDLNDLLVADFETNTIRQLKTSQDAPAARRRHCSGFIGSSMLVFGGFNGQYFQDLHYISVHEARPKYEISSVFDEKVLEKQLNKKEFSDFRIKSI
jgi:N-acetylneuraminic acid mutarotase